MLSEHFSDPNGDTLTYMVSAGDAVEAEIRADTLLLIGLAGGSTNVEVTATDPDGLSANQSFGVNVMFPNQAPIPVGTVTLPPVYIRETTKVKCCSEYFTDPDGDRLVYVATSGDEEVLEAAVLIDTLYLQGRRRGTAQLQLVARDPGRLEASRTVTVGVTNRPIVPPPPPPPNRSPVSSKALGERTIGVADTALYELGEYFSDPDNDALTYTATGDTTAARFVVADAQLRITAKAEGSTSITVRAADPSGLYVEQTLAVTVSATPPPPPPNRSPVSSKALGERTIGVADTALYELGEYFSDPDNDALTYTATGDTTAARFVVADAQLRITAKAEGSTSITVRAADPSGLYVEQTLAVTVSATPPPPPPNRSPVSSKAALGERTIGVADTALYELGEYFSDPDNDALTYTATGDTTAARFVVADAQLRITAKAEGSTSITVRAADPSGLYVEQTLAVTVSATPPPPPPNRSPVSSKALRERTIGVADTALYELGEYFSDPDNDALTYTATGDTTAARFVVADAQLRITAKAEGSTSITVRAADPSGLYVEQTLAVTVQASTSPQFSLAPAEDTPEGETLTYTIMADQPPTDDVLLVYILESLNGEAEVAREGATPRDGTLIQAIQFPAGETSVDVEFEVIDDDVIEPPRDTLVMWIHDHTDEDTVLVKEGVCDRVEPVQEEILFWSGYRTGFMGDLTRCAEPDSEALADLRSLRLVGPATSPDIGVDTLPPINPEDFVLEDWTPEWIPERTSRRPDRAPLQLTKADLSGLSGLIEVWLVRYDMRSVDWSEQIFSGHPILEQIRMSSVTVTDLPASTFEGINAGEGECPSRTLYYRSDGTPWCELVSLGFGVDIEGTMSADLLDPFPNLRAFTMHSEHSEGLTEIPVGFFDDVPELRNLHLSLPIESLDADLLAKNPELFHLGIVGDTENDLDIPTGFLQEQEDLIRLNLSRNGLDRLRADVFPDASPTLSQLSLSDNNLTILPAGFLSRFPALELLDLSSNAFESLPDGFFAGLERPIQRLFLHGNPGPDGDPTTEDFSMTARLVRTDNTDLNAVGPATIAVEVPLGSPTDIEFEALTFGGTFGFIESVTATNQETTHLLKLRAGRTRTDSIRITLVDTVPYFNVIEPSDVDNTAAEITIVPSSGTVDISSLRLEASDIAAVRLFESGDISIPRLLKPLPTIRLLRGGVNYSIFGGLIRNPDRTGKVIIDMADYFGPQNPSSQTISVLPDPNLEFGFAATQVFDFDTTSVSPLVIDTTLTTKIGLDPQSCSAYCFEVGTQTFLIEAYDDTTYATLRTSFEVEVAEVDTTKLNIEWVDVNGNLGTEVAAAIDSAADRWGRILADVRDARIPPTAAPRLGLLRFASPEALFRHR